MASLGLRVRHAAAVVVLARRHAAPPCSCRGRVASLGLRVRHAAAVVVSPRGEPEQPSRNPSDMHRRRCARVTAAVLQPLINRQHGPHFTSVVHVFHRCEQDPLSLEGEEGVCTGPATFSLTRHVPSSKRQSVH